MANLTMAGLIKLQNACGVLEGEKVPLGQTWEQWIEATFDLSDPELVKFLDEWRLYLDAQKRFYSAYQEQLTRLGQTNE